MNVNFPLISQPGVLLSLDDEAIFHRLLSKVLHRWEIRCFTEISDFTRAMEQQVSLQELACEHLTQLLADWREEGVPLREGLIRFWEEDVFRDLASLIMVDYRMPHASGIDVLSTPVLHAWRGGKLLLTAHADDRIAVEAFNGSLIDQFVSKQVMAEDPRVIETIVSTVAAAGNGALQRVWAAQITHLQQQCLDQCQTALMKQVEMSGWTRHAVLGQPFGILGKTREGLVQWLQLETADTFSALLEMLETSGVGIEDGPLIREGKALPLLELGHEGEGRTVDVQNTIELGCGGTKLLGAIFDVGRNPE